MAGWLRFISASAVLAAVTVLFASPTLAQASPHSETVHVAPPTGERETDRASILAALEQVRPGGTIQFGPGTYLVGEIIPIATPRLTLLGDPAGTTLRGCEAEDFAAVGDAMIATWTGDADPRDPSQIAKVRSCDLLQLTGGRATVRNLTFEQAWKGLTLGCCEMDERGVQQTVGGYLIEDNTFRDIVNGIRGILWARDPTVIRGNRFINTFHAVAAHVSHLHVLDNQVSVPEPARVSSIGHPGFAITLAGGTMVDLTGQTAVPCDGNVIAAPDFFVSGRDPESNQLIVQVPKGRFSKDVLEATGFLYREIPSPDSAYMSFGVGLWVGISRDPETGELKAASDIRTNSAAVAY